MNNLENPTVYGDHIEIFCISHLYSVEVWVYEKELNFTSGIKIRAKIQTPGVNSDNIPLKLLYLNNNHYEPLFALSEAASSSMEDEFSSRRRTDIEVNEEYADESVDNFSSLNGIYSARQPYVEKNIKAHNLGEMNYTCTHCGALYFKSEETTWDPKSFNKCCMGGKYLFRFISCEKCGIIYFQFEDLDLFALCFNCRNEVVLEDLAITDILKSRAFSREIIPTVKRIENLLFNNEGLQSKNFRKNIRQFNSALAFASFGASLEAGGVPGRGPYSFRVQGIIYHLTSNLNSAEKDKKYAQLYFIDSSLANQYRVSYNRDCDPNLFNELDQILRDVNGYAKIYKMLYEIEKEEKIRCNSTGEKLRNHNISLIISNGYNEN